MANLKNVIQERIEAENRVIEDRREEIMDGVRNPDE
jgi:hypothetical protein